MLVVSGHACVGIRSMQDWDWEGKVWALAIWDLCVLKSHV